MRRVPDSPASSAARPSAFRIIARGSTWITISQFVTGGGNLALTPFIIHGLGVDRYGLYILTVAVTAFLGTFNGGLGATANRYFPIYAGRNDRIATTRLLATFILLVLAFGLVATAADWFVSPLIVDWLRMDTALRSQSLFLFRTLGLLLTLGLSTQLMQAVVTARQRFDRVIQSTLLGYALWVAGLIWVIDHKEGLRGLAIVVVLQQLTVALVIFPASRRYLSRQGFSLLPWCEVRQLFTFSAKVQVAGLAWYLNNQLDTLIVGGALSVRTVGLYNTGNSFATQLNYVTTNVLSPTAAQLGNTYGEHGAEATFQQFRRIQRLWVAAVSGWSAVGMAAAYFGVVAWLGPEFHLGGWVAVILIAGNIPLQYAWMLSIYVNVMLHAGIDMRFGLVMLTTNVALMLPLALISAAAVAGASGIAQLVGAAYILRSARRDIRPDLPNFFTQVPFLRACAAALVTLALEFLLRPHLTEGVIGLLECGGPALLGLVTYSCLVVGPRRSARFLIATFRSHHLPPTSPWRHSEWHKPH